MKTISYRTHYYENNQTRKVEWFALYMLNNKVCLVFSDENRMEHTEHNILYFEIK